ncbi:hypothetical protein ACHAXT_002861 [Thalassiosira profunda]
MAKAFLRAIVAIFAVSGRAAAFSILPPACGVVRSVAPPQTVPAYPSLKDTSPRSVKGAPSTALEELPSWAAYAAAHIAGGTTGTPIVVRATKTWYSRLPLPSWTPPNFVFGPVWTLLYGLMGVAVSRIAASGSPLTKLATRAWIIHYALNLIWAPVFFGLRRLREGLAINFVLIGTLGYVMRLFHSIDPLSAYLLLPYLLWVLYATKLNETICKLNPVLGGVNKAMLLADVFADEEDDGEYSDAMLQYDLEMMQTAAAKYAGL